VDVASEKSPLFPACVERDSGAKGESFSCAAQNAGKRTKESRDVTLKTWIFMEKWAVDDEEVKCFIIYGMSFLLLADSKCRGVT
jgi:hypothetical protein